MERGVIRDFVESTLPNEQAPVDHLEAWRESLRRSGLPVRVMPATQFDELMRRHIGCPTLEVGSDY
jgi:hypothetical protein